MLVSFLAASDKTPATKRFTLQNNQIVTQGYPNIYLFDSRTVEVENIEQLRELLEVEAANYACLLKGPLTHPITGESRRNTTETNAATELFVGDIDGIPGITSVEQFIQTCLPAEFHDVDYIVQYSCSYGVLPEKGLSAHFFMLLNRPVLAPVLKSYITHMNLNNQALRDSLKLNRTGTGLKWVLDRTACQNDKLIYIAPPICEAGVVDYMPRNRISLVKKGRRTLAPDLSPLSEALNRQREDDQVNHLREGLGLKKKLARYKMIGDVEICANPDPSILSAPPRHERGFVYLSVNNGESYPYWYPENNPRVLFNWKGEPAVLMQDFLPDYWRSINRKERTETQSAPTIHYLAFRDFATDVYYNGIYNETTRSLQLARTSGKDKLKDFLVQHGQPVPDTIPDWEYSFRPDDTQIVDLQNRKLNKFIASDYLLNPTAGITEPPTVIDRILWSVVGNDKASYHHLVNWLAALLQTREKIGTAWVLHGIEGTGKGLLYHNILKPLLGPQQCAIRQLHDFEDQFNEYLETCLLLFIDEAAIHETSNAKRAINFLKNLITERTGKIRRMFSGPTEAIMRANVLFASNNYDALHISPTDRRFNIAPRQEVAIQITQADINSIAQELHDFAGYLLDYNVDQERAQRPLQNEAKSEMRLASMTSNEQFIEAIRAGDCEYFAQYLDTPASPNVAFLRDEFQKVVRKWVSQAGGPEVFAMRDDMLTVYAYLQDAKQVSPNKFTRMLAHHNMVIRQSVIDNKPVYGTPTTWHATDAQKAFWTATNVVPLRMAK